MSELDLFREFLIERLTTEALEIFGAVEKTFTKYDESARRPRLDVKPEINLHLTDVQQLSLPEPPQIKEEQELWTSQEEEQLQGLQSETTDSIFTQEFSKDRMSKLHLVLHEKLTTAGLEIFVKVEKKFAEYEEEIMQLQRLLDVVTQPEVKLHRIDVQQLSLPEPPQIKEEQDLWTSQEEELLQGLQSETTDSIFTSSSVKHDSDQKGSSECSHVFQIVKVDDREGDSLPTNTTEEQIKAEPHVQDFAAPEPHSDSQPLSVVAPDCPAAQSLEEEEHGGMMLLQNRTQNNEARPRDNRPQGSHTEKPHQCQQCKRQFADKSALLKHMRTHSGEKPYQCQECSKMFRTKTQLLVHMRTHTCERPYQCQECSKSLSSKQNLIRHLKTHTGERPYQCQECNKSFISKHNLLAHLKAHTCEKPYQCQVCSKNYSSKHTLLVHMWTHTGEGPYQCQECSRNFSSKQNVLAHMAIHSCEKPYQCQECSEGFSSKHTLLVHMWTHTGERPYQCQECSKLFNSKQSLFVHMRTHTGERPYQCQECSKRFSYKRVLIRHMTTHTQC
ncbi:zinc finger protein 300-like [Osmerus mordax]|uniref:zinc finger protein 300-like n=1 Tax=Osmerus mordax TaxID=8014 RepID=UPI0035101DBA